LPRLFKDTFMYNNKKVVVVMPAYNAEKTLVMTYNEIPRPLVDEVILVDDASLDNTAELAMSMGIEHVILHEKNRGYGSNQKTCYKKALSLNADIIIMLHPDYQYTPQLIPAMVSIIGSDLFPVVLGSRILGGGALRGGMPLYKYIFNRLLTLFENIMIGTKLSEYHTGYRAFSKEVLQAIPFDLNNNDFIFDNEILSQILYKNFQIAEITCPTKYFHDASSINFSRSVKYGLGVLRVSCMHRLQKWGWVNFIIYS